MGRIRTIKPEFPHSETIGALSREARLFFIMLWTIADDAGRVRGALGLLAGLLYPYDSDASGKIEVWSDELIKQGCIRHYVADGKHYIDIPKWLEHQKIEKPSKSRLPPFEDGSPHPRRVVTERSTMDLGPRTLDQDQDLGPLEAAAPPATAPKKSKSKQTKLQLEPPRKPTRLSPDWKLSHKNTDHARAEGLSEIQMAQEAKAFRNYWVALSGTKATKMDWDATWHNWCLRFARDKGLQPRPELKAEAVDAASQLSLEEWKIVLRHYAVTSNWPEVYGPPPGAKGCRVPKELLPDDLDNPE